MTLTTTTICLSVQIISLAADIYIPRVTKANKTKNLLGGPRNYQSLYVTKKRLFCKWKTTIRANSDHISNLYMPSEEKSQVHYKICMHNLLMNQSWFNVHRLILEYFMIIWTASYNIDLISHIYKIWLKVSGRRQSLSLSRPRGLKLLN